MTVTENLLSASITDYNATPPLRISAGQGAGGFQRTINDYITNSATAAAGNTYRMVRVPASAAIKSIVFECAAQGGSSAIDIGVFYSNDPLDPSYDQEAGAAIIDNFFVDNLSTVSAVGRTDETNQSGQYTADKRNQPLWEAVGLTYSVETNPWLMDAYFDIVITAEATLTNAALMGLQVNYVQPGD